MARRQEQEQEVMNQLQQHEGGSRKTPPRFYMPRQKPKAYYTHPLKDFIPGEIKFSRFTRKKNVEDIWGIFEDDTDDCVGQAIGYKRASLALIWRTGREKAA